MNMIRHTLILASAATLVTAYPAFAQNFNFTKIVDTATSVPGSGSGNFNDFNVNHSVIEAGQVAFRGDDDNGDEGIYLFDGATLSEVAFFGQTPPGLPGFFYTSFDDPRIEVTGGVATVGFAGEIDSLTTGGDVSVSDNGTIATRHADTIATLSPTTGTTFDNVFAPGLSGGAVVFKGNATSTGSDFTTGIYTNATGPLTSVVDTDTPVPGLPTYSFADFDDDVAFDGNIAIEAEITDGSDFDRILMLATTAGSLTVIADTVNTASPSSGVLFDDLAEPGIDGSNVAFGGEDQNGLEGIYTNLTGPLTTVADENTLVPGQGTLTFHGFDLDKVSIDGSRILFEARFIGGDEIGIYLWDNGTLLRVIDTTQLLDGKAIAELNLGYDSALSGPALVFTAEFDDGSLGIYTAAIIPEPASLGLLAAGAGILLASRAPARSRRKRTR